MPSPDLCFKEKPWSPSLRHREHRCTELSESQPEALLWKSLRLPPDSARWSRLSAPWINTAGWGREFLTFPGLRGDLRSLGSFPGQTGCRHQLRWQRESSAAVLRVSEGWRHRQEQGKNLSDTSQTSGLEKSVSPASPFLIFFFLSFCCCYFIDRVQILISVSYFLKAEKWRSGQQSSRLFAHPGYQHRDALVRWRKSLQAFISLDQVIQKKLMNDQKILFYPNPISVPKNCRFTSTKKSGQTEMEENETVQGCQKTSSNL